MNVERTGYQDKSGTEIYSDNKLKCISENHTGSVEMIDGIWQSDCCGWGFEGLHAIDEDDIEIITEG